MPFGEFVEGSAGPGGGSGGGGLPLTVVTGVLGSTYTPTSTMATFLTTGTLAIGTWLVEFDGSGVAGAADDMDYIVALGTALGTLTPGKLAGSVKSPGNVLVDAMNLRAIATITQAGTLVFQARSTTGTTLVSATSDVGLLPNATGYIAIKIG